MTYRVEIRSGASVVRSGMFEATEPHIAVIVACGAAWDTVKRVQGLTWTATPSRLRDRILTFWRRLC